MDEMNGSTFKKIERRGREVATEAGYQDSAHDEVAE
jgi:hypothetical protein